MRISKSLREAKTKIEKSNYPNVQGVGVGYKIKDGKQTKDLAIVVFVNKKVDESELSADSLIPKEIVTTDGKILIDVVQSGEFMVGDIDNLISNMCSRKRPISPGYSVGHGDVTAGTIGLIVKK